MTRLILAVIFHFPVYEIRGVVPESVGVMAIRQGTVKYHAALLVMLRAGEGEDIAGLTIVECGRKIITRF